MIEGARMLGGSGRAGLGRAFAERLAALGCAVGVHGMREHGPAEYGEGTTLTDTARAIGEAHGVPVCRAALGDLTDGAEVARVVAEVEGELGPIDLLVHNAGGDIVAEVTRRPRATGRRSGARSSFHPVVDLQAAIKRYIAGNNDDPKPSSGPRPPTRSSPSWFL